MTRVLVAEDDTAIRELLRASLSAEGFEVEEAGDGDVALERARTERFDLLLLDWALPTLSGIEVCRSLRAESDLPIIMLTARDREVDRVLGLELGADDYVSKPFSTAELVSRVRALLRRRELDRATSRPATLRVGGIELDHVRHEVVVDGTPVSLTPSEFRVLVLLAEQPGRAFTRTEIMEHLWRTVYVGDTRAADGHIAALRRKIERDSRRPERIVTVREVGYRLEP